ncbi:MAG: glycosyltransferase family 39 protein [Candidatus Diapherotrites archaeon]|nr:glycosyltransferase family 39 protein [Candidatus Diapherotrites archaeon]
MVKMRTEYFALLLLLIFTVICTTSILNKYLTVDESLYIVSGYSYLKMLDFRLNPEHPVFTKMLYGVPLLLLNPKLPIESKNWKMIANKIDVGANYGFAADFYKENLEMFRTIIFSARLVAIALAVVLGLLIFFWSREAFGSKASLLALFLYCFEPNIIAHSRLATLDMPLTLFVFASFYFAWKFARSAKVRFLILSSLCLSFAVLTKYVALLFFPLLFLFILLQHKELSKNRMKFFKKRGLLYYAFIFSTLIIVPVVLANALYALECYKQNQYVFLPARMFEGFNFIRSWVEHGREGYLFGEFRTYIPEYFLVAFIIKTTLAFLLILTISFYLFIKKPKFELFSILVPALLFFATVSLFSKFYLGLRYILPAFPFLFVFVSGAFASRLENITKNRMLSVLLCALLAWHAFASLTIYPHYLAYFNELIGGPANGAKYLTDSNIDWGQDFFYFMEFAKRINWKNPRLAYFGWPYPTIFMPFDYSGVCKPAKGRFAVSVTMLTGYSKDVNCWRWLLNYEPKARIGWSIYYYEIN